MTHASLTLRTLERILLVDEERIITENSPFGKGQNNEKTLERSFIKTLLTGNDDADIKGVKKNKSSKESIKKKLTNLEEFLKKFFPSDDDSKTSLDSLDSDLEKLEKAYDQAEKELNDLIQSNNALLEERNRLKAQADLVSGMVTDDTVLLGRFEMLERKYVSDRERLEANTEAATYMEQHRIVSCPLCGTDIEQDAEIDIDVIQQANSSEILKIDAHIEDLRSTQDDVTKSLGNSKNEFTSLMQKISYFDEELGEVLAVRLEKIEKYSMIWIGLNLNLEKSVKWRQSGKKSIEK